MPNYFVAYESRYNDAPAKQSPVSNVILRGVHPLVWAAQQPKSYAQAFTCFVLFWEEISDDVATHPDVIKHFSVESNS